MPSGRIRGSKDTNKLGVNNDRDRGIKMKMKIQNQLTDPFKITQGLKQDDELASTLFNVSLEYMIKKMSISLNSTLINKSSQIAAYAYDINMMEKSITAAKEVYIKLQDRAREIGLNINIKKTKIPSQTRRGKTFQNI